MNRKIILDVDFDFFVCESPLLDWGHSESFNPMMEGVIWMSRALGSPNLNDWLKSPHDVTPESFWDDMKKRGWEFAPSCSGYAAPSHGQVGVNMIPMLSFAEECEIWHFDAHHDLGYKPQQDQRYLEDGMVECGNFLGILPHLVHTIKKIVVVYPEWRRQPCPITGKELMYELDPKYNQDRIDQVRDFLPDDVELEFTYYNDHQPPKEMVGAITIAQSPGWVPPWWDSRFANFLGSAPAILEEAFPEPGQAFELRDGFPLTWDELVKGQELSFDLMKGIAQ